jgi:hypothetical protein
MRAERGLRTGVILGLLAAAMLLPAPAEARNMKGKFGLGFQQTLLGARGLGLSYWAAKRLSIDLVLGAGFVVSDKDEDGDRTSGITILGALGLKFALVSAKFCNLSLGLKFDLGWANRLPYEDAGGNVRSDKNVVQWGLEIPLEVEFFLTDIFSITLGTGFTFTMVPDSPGGGEWEQNILYETGLGYTKETGSLGIGLGVGSLFGQAGFTFYF